MRLSPPPSSPPPDFHLCTETISSWWQSAGSSVGTSHVTTEKQKSAEETKSFFPLRGLPDAAFYDKSRGFFFYRLCSDMSSRSDRKEVAEAPKPSSIGIFRIVFNIFPFLSGEELCVKRYTISRRWKRSTSKDGEVGDRISVRKSVSQIFLQFWKIWHFRFTFLPCTNL